MKLVRQVRLHFQEGTSDKVYEVDLCEVGADRFVVNFRYGRRGSNLRDGSKTPLPVSEDRATRVFDKLVASKTKKGYREAGTPSPQPAPAAPPPPRVEDIADPRHRRLLTLLGAPSEAWTDLDRLIYRVGELRVAGATDALVSLLRGAPPKRQYNLARALLRCGEPTALPALFALWESQGTPRHVRGMAEHAITALAPPDERDRFLRRLETRIPRAVLVALQMGRTDAVLADLADMPIALELLYLCDAQERRPQLLELLRQVPLRPPHFQAVRRIFKAAEALGDGDVYGLLVTRIARDRAMYTGRFWRDHTYLPGLGRVKRGDPRLGFSSGTRRWFVRRSWRTLRRLGDAGMAADYTDLAAGVLLSVSDDTLPPPQSTPWYDWSQQRTVHQWRPGFGVLWAFGLVLFRHSPRFCRNDRSLGLRYVPDASPDTPAPDRREEAYPELWDACPDALVALLEHSRCAEVQAFAARAFRANPEAWARLSTIRLLVLLGSDYAGTAELAADIAVTRYDPHDPDLELVLALASCPWDAARSIALGWIRANPPAFLAHVRVVVGLVLNDQAETRRLALEILGAASMTAEHARVVVEAVLDHARRSDPDDPAATERLRDAAGVLLSAFSPELRTTPLDVVAELLRHGSAGVAELGAKILLGHDTRPPELPDELLAAVMTSPHTVVRGIGIRLYGELPDAVLAERFRVLCDLVTNRHADVRAAVRPIVARLAGANPSFARTVVAAVLPAICADGPEGMHADVVRLLRRELASALPALGTDAILKLLRSPEGIVQELGGELLRAHADPASLSLPQISELACSDILTVRQASWSMLEARVAEAQQAPDALLAVLDSSWEDSRAFGFLLVDELIGPSALSAELAIAICDSVRPDVQAFGRRTVTRMFETEAGPTYLLKLSQHPDPSMQLFVSTWLDEHAAGHPDRIERLAPWFLAVLTRPNRGGIAKVRVLAFLEAEATRDERTAGVVSKLMQGLSASESVTQRASAIATLAAIRRRFPSVETGLHVVEPEVRGAV